MNATVVGICSTAEPGTPLREFTSVTLEAGRGILGDRYHAGIGTFSEKNRGKPDVEVTLIESEEIERFAGVEGRSRPATDFRRNLVTRGVRLNDLVGRRFLVGETELEGIRLCEPCAYLAGRLTPLVLEAMVHRAGLRARIVRGGVVRVGDEVGAAAEA